MTLTSQLDAALPDFTVYCGFREISYVEQSREDPIVEGVKSRSVQHDAVFGLHLDNTHEIRSSRPDFSTFVPTRLEIHWQSGVAGWAELDAYCPDKMQTIFDLFLGNGHAIFAYEHMVAAERSLYWIVRDIAKIYESVVDVGKPA